MNPEKLIILGCDDSVALSLFLKDLNVKIFTPHRLFIAGRLTDLMDMVTTLQADLVLLLFRNNQTVLEDLLSFCRKPKLPVLCITPGQETGKLQWPSQYPVFSCCWNSGLKNEALQKMISSICAMQHDEHIKYTDKPSSFVPQRQLTGKIAIGSNLSRYVLELDQKTEILARVKKQITSLYDKVDDPTRRELSSIVNSIKSSCNNKKLWADFKLFFEESDPNFLKILSSKYPELTQVDLKYCCYIKMNMSNDDIGNLLGINQESVRTHKYRLKCKMLLPKEQDLLRHLKSVSATDGLFS